MNGTSVLESNMSAITYQLWLPSLLVAIAMCFFLGFSFCRHHRRAIKKRKVFLDYAALNLDVKRPRISSNLCNTYSMPLDYLQRSMKVDSLDFDTGPGYKARRLSQLKLNTNEDITDFTFSFTNSAYEEDEEEQDDGGDVLSQSLPAVLKKTPTKNKFGVVSSMVSLLKTARKQLSSVKEDYREGSYKTAKHLSKARSADDYMVRYVGRRKVPTSSDMIYHLSLENQPGQFQRERFIRDISGSSQVYLSPRKLDSSNNRNTNQTLDSSLDLELKGMYDPHERIGHDQISNHPFDSNEILDEVSNYSDDSDISYDSRERTRTKRRVYSTIKENPVKSQIASSIEVHHNSYTDRTEQSLLCEQMMHSGEKKPWTLSNSDSFSNNSFISAQQLSLEADSHFNQMKTDSPIYYTDRQCHSLNIHSDDHLHKTVTRNSGAFKVNTTCSDVNDSQFKQMTRDSLTCYTQKQCHSVDIHSDCGDSLHRNITNNDAFKVNPCLDTTNQSIVHSLSPAHLLSANSQISGCENYTSSFSMSVEHSHPSSEDNDSYKCDRDVLDLDCDSCRPEPDCSEGGSRESKTDVINRHDTCELNTLQQMSPEFCNHDRRLVCHAGPRNTSNTDCVTNSRHDNCELNTLQQNSPKFCKNNRGLLHLDVFPDIRRYSKLSDYGRSRSNTDSSSYSRDIGVLVSSKQCSLQDLESSQISRSHSNDDSGFYSRPETCATESSLQEFDKSSFNVEHSPIRPDTGVLQTLQNMESKCDIVLLDRDSDSYVRQDIGVLETLQNMESKCDSIVMDRYSDSYSNGLVELQDNDTDASITKRGVKHLQDSKLLWSQWAISDSNIILPRMKTSHSYNDIADYCSGGPVEGEVSGFLDRTESEVVDRCDDCFEDQQRSEINSANQLPDLDSKGTSRAYPPFGFAIRKPPEVGRRRNGNIFWIDPEGAQQTMV